MESSGPVQERESKTSSTDAPSPSSEGHSASRTIGSGSRLLIAAFDAGNTTGTALYESGRIVLGRVKGRKDAYEFVQTLPDCVEALAYEQYVIRQGVKEEHADVLYINGAIEAEAHRRGIPFYRYTPRQSKSRVSDDTLKELGWWPGFGLRTGGHAADAARILLCTLIDEYPQEMMNAELSSN